MLKEESVVYLLIYINISCICKNNAVIHVYFGQQDSIWINTEGKSLIMKSIPILGWYI